MTLHRKSESRSAVERAVAATIEPLEIRRMLSTVHDVDIDGDGLFDVQITGTSGTDRITIYLDPLHDFSAVHDDLNGDTLITNNELHYGGMPETFDVATFGGTDTVNVRLLSDLSGALHQPHLLNTAAGKQLEPGEYYSEGLSIYVDLGAGNDKFEISSPTDPLSTNVFDELNSAKDELDYLVPFDVQADPEGADLIDGGDLVVQVEGGSEKDTINFNFSRTSVICSSLLATSDAGSGDDTVNLTLPDFRGDNQSTGDDAQEGVVACFEYYSEQTAPTVSQINVYGEGLTPSNVSVAIDLGSGKNTLNINAHTLISASDVHIEVDGGKDTDIINDNEEILATSEVITLPGMDEVRGIGERTASYVVDIELGSGNDSYFQNADFSSLRKSVDKQFFVDFDGEVTYNVRGDSGKDIMKVKDVDNGLDPEENTAFIRGKLEYNLYGGTDDDNIQFDTNPGSQFAIQGGELKVLVSCDGGNDFGRIDVALVPNVLRAPALGLGSAFLTLSGGSGNDKLGMMVEIVGTQMTNTAKGSFAWVPPGFFGARGYPLLDGGSGSDRYDTEGNVTNIIVTRGAETLDETIEPAYIP